MGALPFGPSLPPDSLEKEKLPMISSVASDREENDAEGEADTTGQLPEGFFDDPELDAKVRGVEAPSVRAQRELEEGMKRFQREMAIEIEQSEETRQDLDEDKFEEVAAEEEDFQTQLQDRLSALRKLAEQRSMTVRGAA